MNHKTVAVIGTFILAIGLSTACSSTSSNHAVHSSVKADATASDKDQAASPNLSAQIVKQEGNRVQIQFQVTNLTLSADHYGKKNMCQAKAFAFNGRRSQERSSDPAGSDYD